MANICFGERVSWGMVLVKMLHSQSAMLHDKFSQSMRGTWGSLLFHHCYHSFLTISPYHQKQRLIFDNRLSYVNSKTSV